MPLNANELLLAMDEHARMPLRARLTNALRNAIRGGQLPAGARMPSSRVLATDLGVSRGVVLEAYAQLAAEGFLRTRPGSGTTVAAVPDVPAAPAAAPVPEPARRPLAFDLRPGSPDVSGFPRRQWLAATRRVLNKVPDAALGYNEPWGVSELRTALAHYLARVRGAMVSTESIVVVNGATQGVSLVGQLLLRQGHRCIAVEDPSNAIQRRLLTDLGLQVVGVPVDEHGLRTDLLARSPARALLCTPAHQYPTGAILSAERREELVGWAAAVDALIVEDDYDSEFRYGKSPVGCLQSLDPQHVAMIGSVSKSLAPALRLGWVVSPPGCCPPCAWQEPLRLRQPALDQHVLADFLTAGEYDRNLRALRRRYSQRRAALCEALERHLPTWQVMGVAGGLHLVVRLPDNLSENGLVAAAAARGVHLLGVQTMTLEHAYGPALILSFARGTRDVFDEASRRLAAAAQDAAAHDRPNASIVLSGVDWYEQL
jgi:GntR family transcriptional regulator/MocR family aminotransferase